MKTREEVLKDLQLAASICNDNITINYDMRYQTKNDDLVRYYENEIAEHQIILNAINDAIYIIEHKVVK